jgi:hypothetical protein
MNGSNKYLRTYILGSDAQGFIKRLIGENSIPNEKIIFRRDNDLSQREEDEKSSIYYSTIIPANTELILAPYDQPGINDSIFFIESWTYGTEYNTEEAENIHKKSPFAKIVFLLIESDRLTASTDYDLNESPMEAAAHYYRERGFHVTLIPSHYNAWEASKLLFAQPCDYEAILNNELINSLEKANVSFNNLFENYYTSKIATEFIDNSLGFGQLNHFTQYAGYYSHQKLKNIVVLSAETIFADGSDFKKLLSRMLSLFVGDIYIYDIEKITTVLLNSIRSKYENSFSSLPPVKIAGKDEASYRSFLIDTSFRVIFEQNCKSFFNEQCKDIIKKYISSLLDTKKIFR